MQVRYIWYIYGTYKVYIVNGNINSAGKDIFGISQAVYSVMLY